MRPVRTTTAKSILTPVGGYLREAGFTHSLSPARNCTFGCTYCYVPTMRIYGGLKPEDWRRWGQFTTLKTNAAELLGRESRADRIVYCSPLVDVYQPTEAVQPLMPGVLQAACENPPAVFVIQTRGPLILRDLDLLRRVGEHTTLRISFSVTTDRDEVRRRYESNCASIEERLETVRQLRSAGLDVYCTLAPVLPCDPERLAALTLEASWQDLIVDPFHVRATKANGATTREVAWRIAEKHSETSWFDPVFQQRIVQRICDRARSLGFCAAQGPAGFSLLARVSASCGR